MTTPTNMTREPQTGDTIEASRVRDHANVGTPKRYIEGLDPSLSGTTLTILASPAWGVYVGGNLWRRAATEANHTETLTDDAVNHVYFAPNGNIEVNTSGTPADAGSVKLYTITVTSGTPVLTSDDRSTLFDYSDGATFAGPISAPGEKVSGDNAEMSGTDPEYVLTDGATKRKIRLIGSTGALQVLDESDTVLTADLSDLDVPVESKTANFTAESDFIYLANHATPATRIVATLPQTPAEGDTVLFLGGANTAGFRVKENATSMDPIHFLSSVTAGTGSDYWQCASPRRALRVTFQGGDWRVTHSVGAFTNTALVEQHSLDSTKPATVADGTADTHAATVGQVGTLSYSNVDASAEPSAGTIIAQGPVFAHTLGASGSRANGIMPGVIGPPHSNASLGHAIAAGLLWSQIGSTTSPSTIPVGVILSIKGHYKATTPLSRITTASEHFAIGIANGVSANIDTIIGNVTNTIRDDSPQVAVVVDNVDQSIQSYNNISADGAAYTDSTFNADILTGFDFELIVEMPRAADNTNDALVTIKVRDSGGTLRTILNAVNPILNAGTDASGWYPILMLNDRRGIVTNLWYKVEVAA